MTQSLSHETPSHEDEISIRAYWRVLQQRRWLIGTVASLVVLAMTLWTLREPNIYRSTSTLMPLSGARSGLQAALGEFGAAVPFLGGALSKDSPADRLLAVLQSHTLALNVVQYLNLRPLLFEAKWHAATQQWRTNNPPTEQDAVRKLKQLVSITVSRQGVITIAVEYPDPTLAAAIANRYVSALQESLRENAFSLAKKSRFFIAEQLENTRRDLTVVEEALRQFEQAYGIVALDAQTTAAVQATAFLEEQIMTKEVRLGVQQRLTTGASQEVTLLREELRGLRGQLARLQRGFPVGEQQTASAKPVADQAWLPLREAPDIKLRYARLQRETFVQNKLYTLLAQQLEQAKIDEARDEMAFQILDRAFPPDRKSKPKRLQTIVVSGAVGLLLGIVLAFVRQAMDTTVHSQEQVERLLGLQVLAMLPAPVRLEPSWQEQTQSSHLHNSRNHLPASSITPILQYLHTRLKYHDNGHRTQTVLMAGPEATEATEALLVHLALTVARSGNKVLVLDTNLSRPTLHPTFHCSLTPGLAEALRAPDQWQHSIQLTQTENLHFVAAGTITATTLANLASADSDRLLMHYKENYDLILCAAPTSAGFHDAIVLGKKTDATCFVLLGGVSHLEAILTAKHALEAIQAHVAGAVLLDVPS